jgi:hypothetical protein
MREKVAFETNDTRGCITYCPFGFNAMVGSVKCATCVNYGSSNREKKIVYCKIKRRTNNEK